MDGQTDGQNILCILQDIVPLGSLPCLKSENLEKKQGKGTSEFGRLVVLNQVPTYQVDKINSSPHLTVRPRQPTRRLSETNVTCLIFIDFPI